MRPPISTGRTIFLVGAVQFVNILDFMMVMPLGPDFAKDLGVSTAHLGLIGGSYTAAAAVSGLLGAFFLERFDRRKALAVAMLGLVVGTAAGGFARGLVSLMGARILAGTFGGPASSLSYAIIADVVPPEERGRAMGKVMGAFSVASVLGVPAGLELARQGGWRLPFFSVAGLGLVVAACAVFMLPPLRVHLASAASHRTPPASAFALFDPLRWLAYGSTAVLMVGSFLIIPNISAYLQDNLGYPRARLGFLYMAGGAVGFFTMRWIGSLVDRIGSFRTAAFGTVVLLVVLYVGFVDYVRGVPIMLLFVLFMVSMSSRNVPYNALNSKVPAPNERARFMSIQSAVQHFSAAVGAFLSAKLLSQTPSGALAGMPTVAWTSMVLASLLPLMLWMVEKRVQRRAPMTNSPGVVEAIAGVSAPAPELSLEDG